MMLLILTILFPLLHSRADHCHAVDFKVVHTSNLPSPIKHQLQKERYIIWDDEKTFAAYYRGYPNTLNPDVQFMAGCVAGLEDRAFHTCVNATAIGEELSGHNITVEQFQNFYKECNNDVPIDFDNLKLEEEDEMDMMGKDEDDEELHELGELVGKIECNVE